MRRGTPTCEEPAQVRLPAVGMIVHHTSSASHDRKSDHGQSVWANPAPKPMTQRDPEFYEQGKTRECCKDPPDVRPQRLKPLHLKSPPLKESKGLSVSTLHSEEHIRNYLSIISSITIYSRKLWITLETRNMMHITYNTTQKHVARYKKIVTLCRATCYVFLWFTRPRGIGPRSWVPQTHALSIELRAHRNNRYSAGEYKILLTVQYIMNKARIKNVTPHISINIEPQGCHCEEQ